MVAVLALPAVLLPVAACGSEEEESSGPVVTVSGSRGEEPDISINEDASVPEDVSTEVLEQGSGAEVREGDYLRLDVVSKTVNDGQDLVNTWVDRDGQPIDTDGPHSQVIVQAGTESSLPAAVTEPIVGTKVGSRVQVLGRADDLLGDAARQVGLSEDDGVVWVFDVLGATHVDPHAAARGEQAEPEEGMPEVEADGQEAATITIPEGQDPPEELRDQVLIQGDGPEIEEGQALVVQYTGVTWADGTKFDSSWDRDSASAFQIGTGSVVPGWDQGLVGKHVGDRVLLVIPPDMAYGDREQGSIPANSTLVFVVDIVGAA